VERPPLATAITQCQEPTADAERGAAGDQKRHVAAEGCGDAGEFVAAESGAPQGVAGHQRGGGISAATGQPARDRDVFAQVEVGVRGSPGVPGKDFGGFQDEVVLIEWELLCTFPEDGQPQVVSAGDGELVVERHRVVDGGQLVVAVRSARSDPQKEVDLRGYPYPD
jgi:hypothetical protein